MSGTLGKLREIKREMKRVENKLMCYHVCFIILTLFCVSLTMIFVDQGDFQKLLLIIWSTGLIVFYLVFFVLWTCNINKARRRISEVTTSSPESALESSIKELVNTVEHTGYDLRKNT